MLQRTFNHLPGIGEATERRLWEAGISDWKTLVELPRANFPSGLRLRCGKSDVLESIQKYEACNWEYFDQRLKATHKWRAFPDLGRDAVYVDIETDGTYGPESVTVIGAYDGHEARFFIKDRNLDEAGPFLEQFPLMVTFNGASFDLPVIRSRFPHAIFNHVHIDLMYPLKSLGLSGGLKRIEKEVGIQRSAETDGLGGWEAVRLWEEHLMGSREALDLLIEYNREDVVNLARLMEIAFSRLSRTFPAGLAS